MKGFSSVICLALVALGCDRTPPPIEQSSDQVQEKEAALPIKVDQDQLITQQIRGSIRKDPRMSSSAKKIVIITSDGNVSLKGAVANSQEKTSVLVKARRISGINTIDDQLFVTTGSGT